FRLLKILPGTSKEKLQCHLRVCSMRDNRGAYEAVLYVWGTGATEHSQLETGPAYPIIECNGEQVPVEATLYTTLHQLRRASSKRAVWVDSLCIDRSNARELSQQLAALFDIYRNAFSVFMWLG
ncbi:hypothetical protein N657DRAFT_533917, partial [Parathielavia appendiculata]